MKLLCFSDVHGNTAAVRRLLADVREKGSSYDAVIVAGDITNLSVKKDLAVAQKTCNQIMGMLTRHFKRVYVVPGNRDYSGRGKKRTGVVFNTGIVLEPGKKISLVEGLTITSSPELADSKTILVQHSNVVYEGRFRRKSTIIKKARLHLAGHTHTGVFTGNYLNTGFLYRDDSNGAKPMIGGYFSVELTARKTKIEFIPLGPIKRKDLKCTGYKGDVYAPHGHAFPVKLEAI